MTDRDMGRKVIGKRLGFMAVTFAAIFFASSLEVYRDDISQSRARAKAKESEAQALMQLRQTSTSAVYLQLWHEILHAESKGGRARLTSAPDSKDKGATWTWSALSFSTDGRFLAYADTPGNLRNWNVVSFYGPGWSPESTDSDLVSRLNAANDKYEKSLASFASMTRVEKEGSTIVIFDGEGDTIRVWSLESNSVDGYSYDRLFLESQRRRGRLSAREYQASVDQLLREYAGRLPASELAADVRQFREQLYAAERQIDRLQARVASLEKQLAEAERTPLERWLPVATAVLSLLIALSANFFSWRTDRRHSREAELLPLRRQELEQNIAQRWRELSEVDRKVVIPTPQELQAYSKVVLEGDSESRGKGFGPRYRRRL
ncbi:MAG TPA: hypothetical protein VF659_16230 [Pyrinomonadaceae bacterium]|jgi:hypothetical protein